MTKDEFVYGLLVEMMDRFLENNGGGDPEMMANRAAVFVNTFIEETEGMVEHLMNGNPR